MDPVLDRAALRIACRRLDDFYAVQKGNGHHALVEAVTTLRKSFGLTDELMKEFSEWTEEFCGEEHQGGLILGLLIGVMAAEIQHEGW